MEVRVFTKSDCQPCRLTKIGFDKLGISYEEVPLNDEALAYVQSLGYTAAPVVEVDLGDGASTSWSGFRPSMIEQLVR